MTPDELTARLKEEAGRLGFDLAGACAAVEPAGYGRFEDWLASGHAGRLGYLAERRAAYRHPKHVLDGAKSLLVLGMGYHSCEPAPIGPGQGRISRYAWGGDYHDLIHERLRRLADFHRAITPEAAVRGVVDTAPLFEREFAQRAGLGWIGRNTMLINPEFGSWIFLAVLLTSEELAHDSPYAESQCGSCRACLDACPTGALAEPYQVDARRCLSCLLAGSSEPIEEPFRSRIGERVFGCDACQEACPWNRSTATTKEEAFWPRENANPANLIELLALDEEAFRRRFRKTPLWQARRGGLLRNAAIALGNQRPASDKVKEALRRGLDDTDPLVREACAWALDKLDGVGLP
ncbi:MAG TPA: tRNA epoxyqueuosine(34) reductase QueG [Thermoguttaceae bacterium]|nr:tRNA epoxyqueuosine(34) reductase QueG [Thermoguttaceae bacterium]